MGVGGVGWRGGVCVCVGGGGGWGEGAEREKTRLFYCQACGP